MKIVVGLGFIEVDDKALSSRPSGIRENRANGSFPSLGNQFNPAYQCDPHSGIIDDCLGGFRFVWAEFLIGLNGESSIVAASRVPP